MPRTIEEAEAKITELSIALIEKRAMLKGLGNAIERLGLTEAVLDRFDEAGFHMKRGRVKAWLDTYRSGVELPPPIELPPAPTGPSYFDGLNEAFQEAVRIGRSLKPTDADTVAQARYGGADQIVKALRKMVRAAKADADGTPAV